MSESTMRSKVIQTLKPLNAFAVENPCLPGTPDVNFSEGWIELKWLRAWPKRASTIVKLPHYTKEQRIWAFKRRKIGGQAWFLLQVRREWLLLDAAVAGLIVNYATRQELISHATAYFASGLPEEDLILLLLSEQEAFQIDQNQMARLKELK
ncbi:MAG: hypothetical protein GY906_28505 [bacterium]|nr:hypothetical protein [bacterium]